jgi:hypothetical protein
MRRSPVNKTMLLAAAGAVAFSIGLLSTVGMAPAQGQPERFDLRVRNDFFAGFSGDRQALDRGMKACEEDLAKNPKSAEAMVWHGGGVLFLSGQAFQSGDQKKGMEMWTRGLTEMKTATSIKDDPSTRIPRGAVLLNASRFAPPEMAKPLVADGVADYERALEYQGSYFETLGSHPRGELLFGIAEGYARLGDQQRAGAFFERIKKDLPDSVYAKRAATWLETKSLPANETGCVGCHVSR